MKEQTEKEKTSHGFWHRNRKLAIAFLIMVIILLTFLIVLYPTRIKHISEPKNREEDNIKITAVEDQASKSSAPSNTDIGKDESFSEAQQYYKDKKFTEAKDVLEKISAKKPNDLNVLLLLGNTYRDLNEIDNAKDTYNKVIAVDPQNVQAYMNLSSLWAKEGNIQKAQEILQEGLQNNPGNQDLSDSLSLLNITPVNGSNQE